MVFASPRRAPVPDRPTGVKVSWRDSNSHYGRGQPKG